MKRITKRIIWFLSAAQVLLSINTGVYSIVSAQNGDSINVGSPYLMQEQGENGWYLCEHHNGTVTELNWDDTIGGWTSSGDEPPRIVKNEMQPGTTKDLDFKFIPNKGGLYNLSWDINWIYTLDTANAGINADGMTISLIINGETVCSKKLALEERLECSQTIMLEEGDELHFRASCNKTRWYDSFTGFPSVEQVGIYYQKNESGMKELTRDRCNVIYIADDMLARISKDIVMPTEEYSLVRRYIIPSDGRYRVYGPISSKDKNGGGNVIKIYKNGELLREQLCLCGEDSYVDLRVLCKKDDQIDIEASIAEYEGFNYSKWNINIEAIPGTVRDAVMTTSAGYEYSKKSTVKLSDYINNASSNGVKMYTMAYGEKHPMEYDKSQKRWEETVADDTGGTLVPKSPRETIEEYRARVAYEDTGYISPTEVASSSNWSPGAVTLMEIPITEDGTMLIDGSFAIPVADDAELVKVYVNSRLIWSNRIGGEESIRFDEPYDTKCFMNNIHAFANVKAGDTITFSFGKWRKDVSGEKIIISDIGLSPVEGSVLSTTTKWKLNNSVIVDTLTGDIYSDGSKVSNGAYVSNGTTYIPSGVAASLLGYSGSGSDAAVSVRSAAENAGNTVVWAADRYAIIHKGIPGMYTWNELSEIKAYTEIEGGVLNG